MPTQTGYTVQNDFKNGLVTEATGLNFPENACTETVNCIHNIDGSVERREGLDFEVNYSVKNLDATGGVVNSYLWRDVAGDGTIYLTVVQVGANLYFYDASTIEAISSQPLSSFIDLTDFSSSGAPTPQTEECQFSSGNGLLFVTHPFLEAFYVSYDTGTHVVSGTQIDLMVRDFKGMADITPVDTRPTVGLGGVSTQHHYNLLNQGWTVTNLTTWDAGRTDLPSDCDVMWRFKNTTDDFDLTWISKVDTGGGNSPAPKGHYVLNVFNEDRATASGLAINPITTGYQRCRCNAFFAGRVFYSGINYVGYNSKIYFSQIVEATSQYGKCHQVNDPTCETLFDLLPSDGGVIDIQGAGTIIKMHPVAGGLAVFASNGIWLISGSVGIGFTATDYTISKISSIRTLTAPSFVDVSGAVFWWNLEGIYYLSPNASSGGADVKSLTHEKLLSYFYDIPPSSKRNARGFFNTVTGVVQWLFRSTEAGTIEESYQFDSILNFNTFINSFYVWELSDNINVSGMVVVENLGGEVLQETVVDESGNTVVDESGNTVITYAINNGLVVPKFKYLVYYDDSGDQFTFAEERDSNFTDWLTFDDVGQLYTSTFTTGFRVRGDALRKFHTVWLKVYSKSGSDTQYFIKGIWDYASTGDSGRVSPVQYVTHDEDNYSYLAKRIKIRGHGTALQFNVTSVDNEPFHIIGWSEQSAVNTAA